MTIDKMKLGRHGDRAGNAMIIALLMLVVISLVGANVLVAVSTRYDYTQKAVGWSDALAAAEAGADYGFANCRRSLKGTAWSGWKKYNAVTSNWVSVIDFNDASLQLALGQKLIYDLPSGSHLIGTGEGTTDLWYHVEVDAPASMVISGNQWYRVRSTGYAALPGTARAGSDVADNPGTHNDILRKVDLRFDHFIKRYGDYAHAVGTAVAVTPRATRRIEVIARPQTPFVRALHATAASGGPVGIPLLDSYDSTNTTLYPGGLYDGSQRDPAAGIGVNATVYINAPISNLNGRFYGDVQTNGGTLTKTGNISGSVNNAVTLTAPPVNAPPWGVIAMGQAPATLVAGTPAVPLYATYSSINKVTVKLPPGQTSGVANVYVTGDVTGGITVEPGVTLKLWFAGNFSMKASDIDNQNNNAAKLQLYGIDPPAGQSRSFDIGSGSPGYRYFTLDAPGYDFSVNGNPDFVGAWVVKTIDGNGNTTWHYDEALASAGAVTDYQRASWVEDER